MPAGKLELEELRKHVPDMIGLFGRKRTGKRSARLSWNSLFLLFLFVLESSQAQEASGARGALVLPFKIEASLPYTKLFLSSSDPALDLQRASHFLLEQHYEYPLISIPETQRILEELGFGARSILDQKRAVQICRRSDADYLITGNSYAPSKRRLILQKLSFNCRTQESLRSPKVGLSSRIEVQSSLRKILRRVLAFAVSRDIALHASPSSQRTLDAAVILDFSGSMRQDIPEILRQLRYIRGEQGAGSRLGIITMENQDYVEALKMNRDWGANLRIVSAKKKGGEVGFPAFLKALGVIERYENWENEALLLIFTDITLSRRHALGLRTRLQLLRSRSLDLCFFPVAEQNRESRKNWRRLAERV